MLTAATAPATAPRTVVAALASRDGFFGVVRRLDREAAARAAVFRLALFVRVTLRVLDAGRFREGRDFCVDFFRMDFAGLPDLRFATFFPPFLVIRQCPRRSQRVAESIACAIEKNERRITPLATGHSGTETG